MTEQEPLDVSADQIGSAEWAAARVVTNVLGGTFAIHDTGGTAQYDVRISTPDDRTIALEETSYGSDDWKRTKARIFAEQGKGQHAGENLRHRWWVVVREGADIKFMQPDLRAVLESLEAKGLREATNRYDGVDETLHHAASVLAGLGVNGVQVLQDAPLDDEPRILLSPSKEWSGDSQSLTAAISAVFDKRDNQPKLAVADADERHLYVRIEDDAAAAILSTGRWPPPPCPPDPEGVIDVLWVASFLDSAYVLRTSPGSSEWDRFIAATGERANPAIERSSS
jgi:hypothetical protein